LRNLLWPTLSRIKQLAKRGFIRREAAFSGYREHRISIPLIEGLPDSELRRLNQLLPWNAFVVDSSGRRFGNWTNSTKRNKPQELPDYRIAELQKRLPELSESSVLELGCFEGIHTVALCQHSKKVVAVDARVEHIAKTIIRCAFFGLCPTVGYWNLEEECPSHLDIQCDVLHHVGVLYHLRHPVDHLNFVLPNIRKLLMLDTHIAAENATLHQDNHSDQGVKFFKYREAGREAPFAGMEDYAKWLRLEDLIRVIEENGFSDIEIAENRLERNGPRVLIFAKRKNPQ